ncbi:STE like transcription factor-domain-containing protein [Gautieria morchelliformis]|nr:STE like transcription factor-domain-containing protein [Gautieria morchelliformis]
MENDSVLLHHNPSYPSQSSFSHLPRFPAATYQRDLMAHLDRLKFFLATAPSRWSASDATPSSHQHPALNRFLLPSGEYVTCVLWSGLYHITGTDIVRALVFRFEAFGRPVRNLKKFEEGIFSDLRNLKPGHDACLEEPKSPFLDLLFKFQCIRTQKKQKVFYWFSVPHDRLFLDALERDLKREKAGFESTTAVVAEPALSFSYDPNRPLFEQFAEATKSKPETVESDSKGRLPDVPESQSPLTTTVHASGSSVSLPELDHASTRSSLESPKSSMDGASVRTEPPTPSRAPQNAVLRSPFFNMLALFEGSPTYKQRRKRPNKMRRNAGDADKDSSRHILDIGRASLDAARPIMRTQPRNYTTFLAGPGQFGFTSSSSDASPSPQAERLGQSLRAQRRATPLSAPTPGHACPLFSCRQIFSNAESLKNHMRTHDDDNQPADKQHGDMDVDRREVEDVGALAHVQFVRGTQQLRYSRGSPEIPHFTHVLTSPGGSPRYEHEDEHAYSGPSEWKPQPAESPGYSSTVSAPVSSPGYIQGYTYDTSSSGSASSSEVHPPSSSDPSNPPYYSAEHSYPVSAPSHRVNFDSCYPGSTALADPYTVRRPRSVTPSLPTRVPNARRPSTANEVPSSFGASACSSYASSWRHHSGQYSSRGYHPYAAPAHDLSHGTESSHSSPGGSPFAVNLNTPASEYRPESSHAGNYESEPSPQTHTQPHEYAAPPHQEPSPHLQAQFARMVNLESVSPVENLDLTYSHGSETYEDSDLRSHHSAYSASPESVEHPSANYQYTHTSNGALSAVGNMYHLGQMIPAQDAQMHHHHYYEQQVA